MIGLIGYGRFGKLTVKHLGSDCRIVVHTRGTDKRKEIEQAGARLVSLEEACGAEMVILCVPISAMQSTLARIAPLLRAGAVVIDVCSVKVYPVQWMLEALPETVDILATHPMFGPDSASASLAGHKIVLCPQRLAKERYDRIKQWLVDRGLIVVETTPDDHDRQIAVSLALTHFIGRSLSEFKADTLVIDTEGYKRLLHILGVVTNDTWQLFADMHRYNPYARAKREELLRAMHHVHAILVDRD